ncbi:MAG: hypothetical protein JJ868_03345 [Shimia sp.]|uniref:hypothetical protein n=1 Tax=Shimia sp. TaxID=1954381 RepID=UPI001B107567|nr:hypothetical protein [Shimia sp.]MBO6896387.1 hypothetical protein [Shimia sp.]
MTVAPVARRKRSERSGAAECKAFRIGLDARNVCLSGNAAVLSPHDSTVPEASFCGTHRHDAQSRPLSLQ